MTTNRYPFKFLNAYDRGDTDIFFGREEEVDRLYEMIFQTDILLVYGGSGTGKTSLINCGLAGRFQSHDWLAINVRRGRNINDSLQEKLQAAAGGDVQAGMDFDWLEEGEAAASIEALSPLQRQFRDIYLRSFKPIYLIFDQFEELYVIGTKEEQTLFIQTVREILEVDQPVKLIFIIREEYLGHLFDFEKAVPELLRKKLRVEPMNLDKVRQVILGAAQTPNSNIHLRKGEENAIAEGIFSKIKGDKNTLTIQLPYLQVLLDKLYLHLTGDQQRQAEATFSMAGLQEIGDISDVLRDFLEEQAASIQQEIHQKYPDLPEDAVWQVLSPFVTLDGTKEPFGLSTLYQRLPSFPPTAVNTGLQALENRRILRYEEKDNLYEIAHDSLALRIAERRSDEEIALLEIRRLIKGQVSLKEEARALFTERQLNFIEPFIDKLALTEEEQQLITESRRAVAAKKAESERQARAKRRRLQGTVAVLSIFSIVTVALAIWALGQQSAAQRSAKVAEERLLANEKQQAIARAREFAAYGDSYLDLDKREYACESYTQALSILEGYKEERIFAELSQKSQATCQ